MTELKKIKSAINKLNLKKSIDINDNTAPCKENSDKLVNYLNEGNSRSSKFINVPDLSADGHFFYVSADNKYIVDMIIHNYANAYSLVKKCELNKKGIFKKKCYFNALNIDKY